MLEQCLVLSPNFDDFYGSSGTEFLYVVFYIQIWIVGSWTLIPPLVPSLAASTQIRINSRLK